MHSGMPLGCHQRPRCWPVAEWCTQKQSEAITSSATGVSIRSNQNAITSSATGVSSTSRARRRGPATSVPPPKLHTREIEREIECTHARSSGRLSRKARSSGRLSMGMSALGGNHHVHSEAIRCAIRGASRGASGRNHLHARKSSSLTRLARSVSPAVEPPARRRRRRHVLLLGGGVSASSARSD